MEYIVWNDVDNCFDVIEETAPRTFTVTDELVLDAADKGAGIIAIFERGGVAGFPHAYDTLKRTNRKRRARQEAGSAGNGIDIAAGMAGGEARGDADGKNGKEAHGDAQALRLVYGAWLDSYVLIPQTQAGVTALYKIITERFLADSGSEPTGRISDHDNGTDGFVSKPGESTGDLLWLKVTDPETDLAKLDMHKLAYDAEDIKPWPEGKNWPEIPGCEENLIQDCYARAHELYGEKLPEVVEKRLSAELDAITGNGFAVVFAVAKLLSEKAREDECPIGYRGFAGGSLAAMMAGITDINPLPPHYICPECRHYKEPEDDMYFETGWDLPKRRCPKCGALMNRDGYRIPIETMFGYRLDREPDIDFNVPTDYRPFLIEYLKKTFGRDRVILGGTGNGGMHPGAVFILPKGLDINEFTPLQKTTAKDEAWNDGGAGDAVRDAANSDIVTHYSTFGLDFNLFKQDILCHDGYENLRILCAMTDMRSQDVPVKDYDVLKLFEDADGNEDLSGIPEFSSVFARHVLRITRPRSVADLIRISGLIHGTGAWSGNAEELISSGCAGITDVITCRDDILNYLCSLGMDDSDAYKIMEKVRRGRALHEEDIDKMKEYGVPDWYISSCEEIRYLFPRAHAVSYVVLALKLAWFKVHYPVEFKAVTEY